MTKKSQVHFSNRERRPSKGSLPDMDGSNGSVRSPSRSSGAKSPTRGSNGNALSSRGKSQERPGYDRTDTSASGWATENEDDEKVSRMLERRMQY